MKPSEKALLEKFNQIIESNFDNSAFGIDEICHELGTSRSQLYRHIKEKTQLSTSLYIRRRKLIKARELLESSYMKTAEIAYLLGIDSPQNFSKYFTREFGVTPTAYRKQISEEKKCPVEESGLDILPADFLPVTVKRKDEIPWRKYFYPVFGFILCIAFVIYFWKPFEHKDQDISTVSDFSGNSIAIIPFKNLSTPETAYFCDAIMDQIHGSLSLVKKLKVISTASSGKYKNSRKSIPEIAKELSVNYILDGSVMQTGKKIRINFGLVRASDNRSVWTKTYDGDAKNVFDDLSTVSKELMQELDLKLSDATEQMFNKIPTSSPAAYKEYLKGCELIVSRKKEKLEESIKRLSNAIEFDPDFAAAYANRGLAYYLAGESGFIEEQLSFKLTEQNSLTAIRLDSENGLAYANLANIYRAQNKWEQAKTAYEIALKHNPNDALINYWYSLLLRSTGNLKEAIRFSTKAVALDPLYHVIFGGNILNCVYGNELDMAQKNIKEGQILFNESFVYYWVSAPYFAAKKDYRLAIKYCAKANQLNPGIKSIKYQTVFYQAMNGQVDKANTYLTKLPDVPENYISRAVIYAGLQDKSKSLYYLQKAADLGQIPTDVKVSPFLAILRNDPHFKTILKKFGL